MMMLLGVEGRQGHLHHLQLLVVLLLLLQLIVHIEQLHVVLSEWGVAVVSEGCSGYCSEVVLFLGFASESILTFEQEIFLVDHSVSLLHVLARPWHYGLY